MQKKFRPPNPAISLAIILFFLDTYIHTYKRIQHPPKKKCDKKKKKKKKKKPFK
jgi:hypothetical protein